MLAKPLARRSRRRRRSRWRSAAHASALRYALDMPAPKIPSAAIDRAAEAGRGVVKHTPVTGSAALSDRCGGNIVLKAENLQRTGSFKIRGAMSKLAALGDARGHWRHCRKRGQPRPGTRVRRPPRRGALRDLRARGRADLQDRGVPGLRRDARSREATRSTRR